MAYDSRDLVKSLGKNFMLSFKYKEGGSPKEQVLAYGTSVGLRFGRETIDTTNYMSGGWRDELGGVKSWELSGSAYVTLDKDKVSLHKLMELFNQDGRVEVKFLQPTGKDFAVANAKNVLAEGQALITALDVKGDTKGILSVDISLQGCGPVTYKYDTAGGVGA